MLTSCALLQLVQDLLMMFTYVEVDATNPEQVKRLIDLALTYLSL